MNQVEQHYDHNSATEWERLDRHRMEFAIAKKALCQYLPSSGAKVIDIGGGPGKFSIELSRLGQHMTLVDLSARSLELAREKATAAGVVLENIIHADARDLVGIPSAVFDAALVMGPLYHLHAVADRARTVEEALRVIKPGGLIFATFLSRFAPFRSVVQVDPSWLRPNFSYAYRLLESGIDDQPPPFPGATPHIYFAHPGEISPFMEIFGLNTLGVLGLEGIVAGREEKVDALTGADWEAWVELNYIFAQDPYAIGMTDHILYVGRKGQLKRGE